MISKIILARPRGFCAGVDRAIDVVEVALDIFGPPVYVKHAIVHNMHVVSDLEKKGARFVEDLDEVPVNSVLIFSAHGTDPKLKEEAKARGHKVIDATCPLVTKVHLEARRYANEGYFIVYVGHRGHPEPAGVFGEIPEGTYTLIEHADEVSKIKVPKGKKLVHLNQTTLSIPDVSETIKALRKRFPDILTPPSSDICYATTNRQAAARTLAKKCDVVLVIGSQTSSNSQRLKDVSKEEGARAYLVDDETGVDIKWLDGAKTLGITSGASAPEYLIDNMVDFFKKQYPNAPIENMNIMKEEIKFPLPDDLVALARQSKKGVEWVEKHRVASQR